MALTAFEAALVLPLFAGAPAPDPAAPRLRVVAYNMLHHNPHTVEAARHVVALEPDVVVLLEATPPQLRIFTNALPGWHLVAEPRDDAFGIAVLSREPPSSARVATPGPHWMPAIELELPLGDRPVTILAVHPPPPVSAEHTRTRDELLHTVSARAAAHEGPMLVVGDLNATPWSSAMREILGDGPLRSTQRFGLHATWPSWLGPLGLPIDHALVSGPLEPVARSIEPAFGSDHRMLFVELALR
jgi:endonuclease/exonuclease/phosphatase (EEP) superfamily protein YafD